MTRALPALGKSCSENRVARIMRSAGLRTRPRKPFHPRTTRTDHRACPSPNLQKDEGPPCASGQQVVSDITYIPTSEGWLYLVTGAIEEALHTGLLAEGSLFHSDRGSQYTAGPTRQLLARHGLRQSMSARGDCYDNAFAESLFATIKSELLPEGLTFETKARARTELFDYIETFYNRTRLHSALGYKSPSAFLKEHFSNLKNRLN